jgi:hypothetical protein
LKLVIAGGRDINVDPEFIAAYIYTNDLTVSEVISGKAPGIDTIGEQWAKEYAYVPVEDFPADWNDISHPDAVVKTNKFGKKYNAVAGHWRNADMAKYGEGLLLIWDGQSTGSKNMKEEMLKLNKPVYEIILKKYNV